MGEPNEEHDEEETAEENIDRNVKPQSQALTDVAYKELAKINGRINRMTNEELIRKLEQYHLDTGGSDEVLRKRLKNNYKLIKLQSINHYVSNKLLPYYVVVDFEATCQEVNPPNYRHEIIEFPGVIVNSQSQEIIDTFQMFCRPVINPKLSKFCTELTGITQEQVDSAETFPTVLNHFQSWLKSHGLGKKNQKYAIVTDGPWDMSRFLFGQCQFSDINYPEWGRKWINLRKSFSNFYKCKKFCLKNMLQHIGLNFEGRPHCGLDDARNIARILIQMICDGANLQINERINEPRNKEEKRSEESKDEENDEEINKRLGRLRLQAHIASLPDRKILSTYEAVKRERGKRETKIARQIMKKSNKFDETLKEDQNEEKQQPQGRKFRKRRRKKYWGK